MQDTIEDMTTTTSLWPRGAAVRSPGIRGSVWISMDR